ncbi:hypothetical protein BH10PSE14_BH10PSE14_00620 [soil metagenome]
MLAFIMLSLLAASDQTSTAGATPAASPPEKMICKRFIETGSLVKGYTVCKTKQDWVRARETVRQSIGGIDSCRARAEGGSC